MVASSASSAAAGSEGCAEAQRSFANTACSRCSPRGRGTGRRRGGSRGTSAASTSSGSPAAGCRRSSPSPATGATPPRRRLPAVRCGTCGSASSSARVVPAPIRPSEIPRGVTSRRSTSRSTGRSGPAGAGRGRSRPRVRPIRCLSWQRMLDRKALRSSNGLRSGLSSHARAPPAALSTSPPGDRQRADVRARGVRIALAIAAAVGTIGGSPRPFDPGWSDARQGCRTAR